MTYRDTERRKHTRNTFTTTLEYTLLQSSEDILESTSSKGITINISKSGICLYTFNPLDEGQHLRITKSFLPDQCKSATVMWSKRITNEIYKVGLMFPG